MNKKEIVKILEEIGTILELKGENPFKSRAYFNAARTIETNSGDVIQMVKDGSIDSLKGVGQAISEKLKILVSTGELPYYKNLKDSIPSGLFDLLKIPGMGPKKVKTIYEKLHIHSIGELEYACLENRLRDLDGFGEKSQEKILKNIELHKKYNERYHYHVAKKEAENLFKYLKGNQYITRLAVAGSLRRKKETIRDIDFVASCALKNRESIMDNFTNYPDKEDILGHGLTKSAIIVSSGMHCDLRLVEDEQYPFLLHHSTGSKEHNTAMRQRAKSIGLTMNEYGLFSEGSEASVKCMDEAEIFNQLKLTYIEPELRENMGELEAAEKDTLPQLVTNDEILGLFHAHTTHSDGANTIKEMAEACKTMGFKYLGITDHSKSAFYANGLTEDRIKKQQDEIDQINSDLKDFVIFKGIEADILPDGRLDYDNKILATFDFVIASVHSSFQMNEDEMTERICRALKNPYVTMLGHPTGRLLLGREAYPHKMEKILETAARYNRVVEINANPHRLDLDWRWGKKANALNIKTSINPDAHTIDMLQDYQIGLGIARKAWFSSDSVLNTYMPENLIKLFESIRNTQ